jgi:glycosyltransferase involved in cell wall biosynthesis
MIRASATQGVDCSDVPNRRRLRVCHVAYTFYENDGRVIKYAEALVERGDDVDVIALRRAGQAARACSKGVRVHRIQRRSVSESGALTYFVKVLWFLLKSAATLTALQLRRRYDVVHVHNVPDFLVFAALVPKLMGAKIVLDIHDILPELYAGKFGTRQESPLFRLLLLTERVCCRFADHVIVANHLWQKKLTHRALAPERCTPLINYPDLRLFTPRPAVKQRENDKFIMLYPGTLNHHQGLDIAIRALALVKDRMPNAELHIYGEGSARTALSELARTLDLTERVKLMERVPLVRVSKVMATADVGIVPKRADGFGNEAFSTKILEFMACAVPVIVSRTDVDAYYFDETLVHFFIPGDEHDLARAICDVYQHREDHRGRVERASAFAVNHSWEDRQVDYFRVIDRLAGHELA